MKKKGILIAVIAVLVLGLGVGAFFLLKNREEEEPKPSFGEAKDPLVEITTQPKDTGVNFPESISFSIEVDKPEKVKAYQWFLNDSGLRWTPIENSNFPTLTVPCTYAHDKYYVRCEVTDENGTVVKSDKALFEISNKEEAKTVLYVAEHALLPGESLDLEKDAPELGKGKILFDENGVDVTLDHVHIENGKPLLDYTLSNGVMFTFDTNVENSEGCTIHLLGENVLKNNYYYQPMNAAGITLDFCYRGAAAKSASSCITGEGTLIIDGGTEMIRACGMGELKLDADITLKNTSEVNHFSDGVVAEEGCVTLTAGHTFQFDVFGTGIFSQHDITIEDGVQLTVRSTEPYVAGGGLNPDAFFGKTLTEYGIPNASFPETIWDEFTGNGFSEKLGKIGSSSSGEPEKRSDSSTLESVAAIATKKIFLTGGNVFIHHAKVDLSLTVDGKITPDGAAGFAVISICNGYTLSIKDSEVKIRADEKNYSEGMTILSAAGLSVEGNISVENSVLDMELNLPDCPLLDGILADSSVNFTNSTVSVKVNGAESADGIKTNDMVSVINSTVDVNVNGIGPVYGILGNQFAVTSETGTPVKATVTEGIALLIHSGNGTEEIGYTEGYVPKVTHLNGAMITSPANGKVNQSFIKGSSSNIYIETVYDRNDITAPVKAFEIAGPQVSH